jgi:hypothetical protein
LAANISSTKSANRYEKMKGNSEGALTVKQLGLDIFYDRRPQFDVARGVLHGDYIVMSDLLPYGVTVFTLLKPIDLHFK